MREHYALRLLQKQECPGEDAELHELIKMVAKIGTDTDLSKAETEMDKIIAAKIDPNQAFPRSIEEIDEESSAKQIKDFIIFLEEEFPDPGKNYSKRMNRILATGPYVLGQILEIIAITYKVLEGNDVDKGEVIFAINFLLTMDVNESWLKRILDDHAFAFDRDRGRDYLPGNREKIESEPVDPGYFWHDPLVSDGFKNSVKDFEAVLQYQDGFTALHILTGIGREAMCMAARHPDTRVFALDANAYNMREALDMIDEKSEMGQEYSNLRLILADARGSHQGIPLPDASVDRIVMVGFGAASMLADEVYEIFKEIIRVLKKDTGIVMFDEYEIPDGIKRAIRESGLAGKIIYQGNFDAFPYPLYALSFVDASPESGSGVRLPTPDDATNDQGGTASPQEPAQQPGIIIEGGIGGSGREIPPAEAAEKLEATTQALLEQRDGVRQFEERDVLAVVVIDDGERLKDIEGVGRVNMTGLNVMAERLVSKHRNSRVVYVKTAEEAMAKMRGEGRTWDNTFFFVESAIRDREEGTYNELTKQAFVWNLNIPDNSLCNVTPLGFLIFSIKLNELLTRVRDGSKDLDMESLAEIILWNIGEDVTPENVSGVVEGILRPIVANYSKYKDYHQLLAAYSGCFSWNLPRITPENWHEVDEYFDRLKDVYSAV